MCFIFFMLPLVLYVTKKITMFFIGYLIVIEILVVLAVVLKINNETLNYECGDNRLKCKDGIFNPWYYFPCDKIVFVHTEKYENEINIIIISTSRLRNKKIKNVNEEFIKKYPYVSYHYVKLKKLYPEVDFYYKVIKKGGVIKYKLLTEMYKNCVKATYSEEAIDNIKKWLL